MERTLVMGVLNVTPDSFSDGGRWADHEAAIAHGLELIADGADIIDIGGESTRPGAVRPSVDEELSRVIPVVEALAPHGVISVDTMRSQVARAAIAAGAHIINDVSGGLDDPEILEVVAAGGVEYLCQHWRGHGAVMDGNAVYDDVVAEVLGETMARVKAAVAAGIPAERIIIDPGLGFGKKPVHDWTLVGNLGVFVETGHRVVVGASRKRFIGAVLDHHAVTDRDVATAAVSVLCAQQGVWAVRAHDVRAQRDAIAVAMAVADPSSV